MAVSLAKFVAKYGNFHYGHGARPVIDSAAMVDGQMRYVVYYTTTIYGDYGDRFEVTASHLLAMRAWLARSGMVGMPLRSAAASRRAALDTLSDLQVVRGVEQYYGVDGLRQFWDEFAAGLDAESAGQVAGAGAA